jgi:NADPH2:quinone reductase
MKALVYDKAHSLEDFAIKLAEIPEPTLREFDVLVDVHAVGINPGETFIRRTRSAEPGGRVLLGWEFAGVIVETGSGVRGFKTGDRVFGTGDMTRDGAWPPVRSAHLQRRNGVEGATNSSECGLTPM